MSKKSKVLCMVALFSLAAGLLPLRAAGLCCVAGRYEGFQQNYAKPNCPPPAKEKFTMTIVQGAGCGAGISGTVRDAAGLVSSWTGTLSAGLARGCCKLEGSFVTPSGNTVQFKGTICLRLGKWMAKGTWVEIKSSDPCRGGGTWQMSQIPDLIR